MKSACLPACLQRQGSRAMPQQRRRRQQRISSWQKKCHTWEPRQSSWEPPSVPLCTCHIMMRLDRYQGAKAAANSHTWSHTCA